MGAVYSNNDEIDNPNPFSEERQQSHLFESSVNKKIVTNSEDNSVHENSVSEAFDEPFAEDLLIEFLSYVPAEDLVFNCRLVCKQWKAVIDAQSVWRLKCERENVKLPTHKLMELPKHHYRYLYWHAKLETKNLIKNPCGENRLGEWELTSFHEGSFVIENPPVGADPVPAVVGSQSCFATTFSKCEKFQIINFSKNPVHRYLLQHDLVKIRVGEWYCARFDCASEYELKVLLYDKNHDIIDEFKFQYIEEQWAGREWHFVSHEFNNVTNVNFIAFYHMGKDRQFWAGHYGSKMTGAFVELCIK